jgi:hypothetical protein
MCRNLKPLYMSLNRFVGVAASDEACQPEHIDGDSSQGRHCDRCHDYVRLFAMCDVLLPRPETRSCEEEQKRVWLTVTAHGYRSLPVRKYLPNPIYSAQRNELLTRINLATHSFRCGLGLPVLGVQGMIWWAHLFNHVLGDGYCRKAPPVSRILQDSRCGGIIP